MNEFIEAYSDDQTYLSMIKELVNNHPTESKVPENIKYSSFCRLWAVMMVGSIESMVKVWGAGDGYWADISAYFNAKSNEDRVDDLKKAFSLRGVDVDVEMFKDFLAIKYIRNSYIHSDWKEAQREYATSRNFPGDVMNFGPEHFDRMQAVYIHIMNGLGMIRAISSIPKRS